MFSMNTRKLARALFHAPAAPMTPTTAAAHSDRLPKLLALPIFSSDALSSVAYATEEILIALLAGAAAVSTQASWPIALGIGVLLVVVTWSYMQTIEAYATGGGAYVVAKENLGEKAGLVAGAALLIDYVFTVAASVAAGVAALASACHVVGPYLASMSSYAPQVVGAVVLALEEHRVLMGVLLVLAITAANLRGMKESGKIFAIPTYLFIASIAALVLFGGYRALTGSLAVVQPATVAATHDLGWLLLLRAFAAGCAALTGVEAISNCVPQFQAPAQRNAKITLAVMSLILGGMFLGMTYLTVTLGIRPATDGETVLSQLARGIFGSGALYYVVQVSTALILILGANTSFAVFPTLSSEIARDGFLPARLAEGDGKVRANGICVVGVLGALLIVLFNGDPHALIPLYAIGVFLSFTLSEAGMVKHWVDRRSWGKAVVNALGALATTAVFAIVTTANLLEGAWAVLVLVPTLVLVMLTFRAQRQWVERKNPVVLPIVR
jgi:amino acid transporter